MKRKHKQTVGPVVARDAACGCLGEITVADGTALGMFNFQVKTRFSSVGFQHFVQRKQARRHRSKPASGIHGLQLRQREITYAFTRVAKLAEAVVVKNNGHAVARELQVEFNAIRPLLQCSVIGGGCVFGVGVGGASVGDYVHGIIAGS